jgi:DNA repair photolyase
VGKEVQRMKKGHIITNSGVEWCEKGCTHYLGCENNCGYCYARDKFYNRWINNPVIQKAWGVHPSRPWVHVEPFDNALEQLEKDLRRLEEPSKIMVSPMCDPYPSIEKELKLTRRILGRLVQTEHEILLITKSGMVQRDYDILTDRDNVRVIFTITHAPGQAEQVREAAAPSVARRISALKKAHHLGIPTAVSLEPWYPEVDAARIIRTLTPWVDWWIIGSYNYHGDHSDFYREHWPEVKAALDSTGKPYLVKKELGEIVGV